MPYIKFCFMVTEMKWLFSMSRLSNNPRYWTDKAIRMGQLILAHREVTVSPPQYQNGVMVRGALFIYTPTELN